MSKNTKKQSTPVVGEKPNGKSQIRTIEAIFLLLFVFLVGCASNPKGKEIHRVQVAGYNLDDEATAWKLTFGILHQRGILAGGHGKGGYVSVSVLPNQATEARRILRIEILDLSQKQRDSFQIVDQ